MTIDRISLRPTRRAFMGGMGAAASTALFTPAIAQSRQLTIISNRGNADQRKAVENIAADFGKAAGVSVTVNNMDHEAHKTAIRNYLVASPPDICFWFSGQRMRSFVEKNLFEDISDLIAKENWAGPMGTSIGAVTVNGKQYGLPTGGILWGLFYRQDTFDQFGLKAPETFEDFFTLAAQSKKAGLTPMSIGTKDMWTAGGWFDHMNLRINGLDHHMDLMAGKIKYTDASLKEVFDLWERLVKADFFSANHTSYAWDPAAAAVVQKKAAMIDLGNFIKYAFPVDDLAQVRFKPFPSIRPGVAQYEDFSVDSIHIPSGARNKEAAKEFLAYFYKPENLGAYLAPEGNMPARSDCPVGNDPILKMAAESMKTIKGTAQYFDRDTDPDLAQAGMKGFQEFMVRPERREQILGQIERTRARIYG
ncbi:carbohydrate ABC transporter substrate-binding protein, CUT1 family [Rhizobium sp. RU35A]|uniref:ABC transporter substrate-binding protein n=1 Tax=Rhizobium sp. RU35A TaxID=1907414 RepID=UPI000954299D|nr:ABC transporter substrate-binding protein [Rhizobium sp. RU35A]SIQ29826.1 carbohydrate ABC transporter substrate-binding protein, CUT1 family [Rhizobium sp. RU35A]